VVEKASMPRRRVSRKPSLPKSRSRRRYSIEMRMSWKISGLIFWSVWNATFAEIQNTWRSAQTFSSPMSMSRAESCVGRIGRRALDFGRKGSQHMP